MIEIYGKPSPQIEALITHWFLGDRSAMRAHGSENRGVLIELGGGFCLKIKGAGFNLGKVEPRDSALDGPPYGKFTGPPYCIFDFEGKRMVDYSMGHDNAHLGGMSFTQAWHEFSMCRALTSIYPVVQCIAWGKVETSDQPPFWFSAHLWPNSLVRRSSDPKEREAIYSTIIGRMLELHFQFCITGFLGAGRNDDDGKFYCLDIHPLRQIALYNESAISMTCNLAWSLSIERLVMEAVGGRQWVRQAIFEPVYLDLCARSSSADMEAFELWSQVTLAGLTVDGVTTRESWKESCQRGIGQVLENIQRNPISAAIYERFQNRYPG